MSFTSIQFLLFLPTLFLLFHTIGQYFNSHWLILLLASYTFYAATGIAYLPLALLVVTLITFLSGLAISKTETETVKRGCLWLGIGGNCLVLIGLKYLPFIVYNLKRIFIVAKVSVQLPEVTTLSAIAVSFFVFQAVSYLVDVYLEVIEPELHPGYFALSLAFFSKLLQGPIERSGDLLPQLRAPYRFDYENIRFGLLLFTWGFFQKVVIADRLSLFVDRVYGNVYVFSGLPLLLATWFYAFQLYFDFLAYTNMAIGSASMFNVRLTQNFASPYLATSVADFWRRWHISFSRWILDYLFKPLQMKWRDQGRCGTAVALFITFIISGIWHGPKWGFILWGACHGLFLCCSLYWKPYQKRLYCWLKVDKHPLLRFWQIFITFQLISFTWIFFRADTLPDSKYIISHIIGKGWWPNDNFEEFAKNSVLLMQSPREAYIAVTCMLFAAVAGMVSRRKGIRELYQTFINWPLVFRWIMYYSLTYAIIMFSVFTRNNFIYFKF